MWMFQTRLCSSFLAGWQMICQRPPKDSKHLGLKLCSLHANRKNQVSQLFTARYHVSGESAVSCFLDDWLLWTVPSYLSVPDDAGAMIQLTPRIAGYYQELQEVQQLLRHICAHMSGSVRQGKALIEPSIRHCFHLVDSRCLHMHFLIAKNDPPSCQLSAANIVMCV